MSEVVLIWDGEGSAPEGNWTKVLWRSYSDAKDKYTTSIPVLIGENADIIKDRYLAWVYELGEIHIDGKRLVDHLEVRPDFSFWWMTLIAEKCNWAKSPQITDAIRFIAFEHWMYGRSVNRVILASENASLAQCIRLWCRGHGSSFEWRFLKKKKNIKSIHKRLFNALPHLIKAFPLLLQYLIPRWPLRGIGMDAWCKTTGRATFLSYFFNLVPEAAKAGIFESRYWAHLPDILKNKGCQTNWIHLYIPDSLHPKAENVAETIHQFNKEGRGIQVHVTLDTFLDLKVILKSVHEWIHIILIGCRVQKKLFSQEQILANIFPLLRDDWYKSVFGYEGLLNLLFLNLFEVAFSLLPKQNKGVFLQENQPWEYAFIHTWKIMGHGQLIGAPHTTVPYWDLRSFFDKRSYIRTGKNDLPLPDLVALNGKAALDTYLNGGYPKVNTVEVEALRYLHLDDEAVTKLGNELPESSDCSLRVLVLGDYVLKNTQRQMHLLELGSAFLPPKTIFIIKPHPACPIHEEDYPVLRMLVTMEPVSDLLEKCDVAFTSNMTSAAVDAYCANVPVVSVLDPDTLNVSPLNGCEDVIFISTPEELAEALLGTASSSRGQKISSYFTIDAGLIRWKKLLLGGSA